MNGWKITLHLPDTFMQSKIQLSNLKGKAQGPKHGSLAVLEILTYNLTHKLKGITSE